MSILIAKCVRLALLVCTIATVATIGQSSATSFAQSNNWQRYNAEGFSVLLPEHPNTTEIGLSSKMSERRRPARLFTAYDDGVAYVILALDNPQHRDPLSRFIDEIETYSTNAKAERFQQDLSGAGFTAKEYAFGSAPTHNGAVRFYLAADRVYMLEAIGFEDVSSKPSVKQFLDSFSVGSDNGTNNISYANPPVVEAAPMVGVDPATTPAAKVEVFSGKDVTKKAQVLLKPEPMYTEAARQAQITGTVVLRCVFSSTGHVTSLRAVSGLPNGLTERAVAAARNIKFIPASRDGHNVSMWIQLEYNFNLY
jgi:TonB family protein